MRPAQAPCFQEQPMAELETPTTPEAGIPLNSMVAEPLEAKDPATYDLVCTCCAFGSPAHVYHVHITEFMRLHAPPVRTVDCSEYAEHHLWLLMCIHLLKTVRPQAYTTPPNSQVRPRYRLQGTSRNGVRYCTKLASLLMLPMSLLKGAWAPLGPNGP